MNVKRIDEIRFRIERQQGMSADVVGYASDALLEKIKKDHTLQQAANAATLPDPAGNILLMSDAHEGYGFPIGGVMAFDSENGIVSPGAIGFDINCGVRLIKTNLTEGDIRPKIIQLSDELFKNIPSGVGSRLNLGFGEGDLERVTQEGIEYLIKKGFGVPEDVAHTEDREASRPGI